MGSRDSLTLALVGAFGAWNLLRGVLTLSELGRHSLAGLLVFGVVRVIFGVEVLLVLLRLTFAGRISKEAR